MGLVFRKYMILDLVAAVILQNCHYAHGEVVLDLKIALGLSTRYRASHGFNILQF